MSYLRIQIDVLSTKNTFVINIARGEVIVQDELIAALQAFEDDKNAQSEDRPRKGIKGAALDVTTPEPLPKGHPLWKAPNCIIAPHISGIHRGYMDRSFQVLEENLDRQARGEKLINVVDRKRGYASKV